jgi:hypothetical protein
MAMTRDELVAGLIAAGFRPETADTDWYRDAGAFYVWTKPQPPHLDDLAVAVWFPVDGGGPNADAGQSVYVDVWGGSCPYTDPDDCPEHTDGFTDYESALKFALDAFRLWASG